jgi:hypothetical protein
MKVRKMKNKRRKRKNEKEPRPKKRTASVHGIRVGTRSELSAKLTFPST